MKKTKKKSFAEKYGLLKSAKPVRISDKTKSTASSLYRRSNELVENGKDYALQEFRLFGGCPKPGDPGAEFHFVRK